ncbi:MAG: hypothetical protein IT165_24045 [Bryobacterales bacterium]|nr:hypothetical protein [Bryobacterales bacterium]
MTRIQKQMTIGIALGLAVFAIGAAAVFLLTRPVPVEKAIGAAVVQASRSDLLDQQGEGGKAMRSLPQGTVVNLLERLRSREQPFVRVQYVNAKDVSKPGYVRTADLGQWTSPDAPTAWELLALSRPAITSSEGDRRRFIQQLTQFSERFTGTPEAHQATLERARLYYGLANEAKSAGKPEADWKADLASAKAALPNPAPGATESVEAATLRKEIETLESSETKAGHLAADPASVQRALQVQQLEQTARQLYRDGEWEKVLEIANKMSSIDPNRARAWRATVQNALKELSK